MHRRQIGKEVLPEVHVREAILHGSTDRLINLYAPAPAKMLLPAEILPPQAVALADGQSTSIDFLQHVRNRGVGRVGLRTRTASLHERVRSGKVLDLGSRMAYDARWISSDNVAHVLHYHAAALGMFKARTGMDAGDCLIVLEKNAHPLSHKLFGLLGFETLETHRPVRARLLTIQQEDPHTPYHLLPFAPLLMPTGIKNPNIPKIFVPRRRTRCIVNQDEIDAIAREYGFEKIYLEDLPLTEQLGIMCYAREIMAIHGAGLGYLCMRSPVTGSPDLLLTELFSPGLVVDVYRKHIAVLGGRWRGCRGTVTSRFVHEVEEVHNHKSAAFRNFHLDPAALTNCLTDS